MFHDQEVSVFACSEFILHNCIRAFMIAAPFSRVGGGNAYELCLKTLSTKGSLTEAVEF